MLKLFYAPTVASTKVLILLEELATPYQKIPINIRKKVNHYDTYKHLVPTLKTPALLDEGEIFIESSNILLYLATEYDVLWNNENANEILSWLFWETSELSPKCLSLYRLNMNFPNHTDVQEKTLSEIEDAIKILNNQLEGKDYVATDYSIADLGCYPWLAYYHKVNIITFLDKYENVLSWMKRMADKKAVKKIFAENASFDWDQALSEEELVDQIEAE